MTTIDVTTLTVPKLKAHLTDLGVPFKAKARKEDLQRMLTEALSPSVTDGIVDADDLAEVDLEQAQHALIQDAAWAELARLAEHNIKEGPLNKPQRHGQRGRVWIQDSVAVMTPHYRGRALGLKHYQAMGLAEGRTVGQRTPKRQLSAHMPNSERVLKYARQNNLAAVISAAVRPKDAPKLTPRQMRRVRKNMGRGDHIAIHELAYAQTHTAQQHFSLLARTPEGLGIFYSSTN